MSRSSPSHSNGTAEPGGPLHRHVHQATGTAARTVDDVAADLSARRRRVDREH
ncbi:hypothetical protein [Actinomycetospora cinnamomea]|uniref:Uncharacterized protein n=1 Tax=Actinomycetospora cinnamomea TaxID=663609 RepID=A0A2U1FL54_9PSEU|nr:hypothetical protein [Actinomycetospora cinnamomea]PVZ12945.1 hypothetical protein C8D89_10293 [Actinomycetospora cinnamomea]